MELRSVADLQAASAQGAGKDPGRMQQEDFIKLMLEQLKHQDPFKPMDQAQFLGQMAQFSTVSGISEMKESMASLADSLRSTQMLNASTLIGKQALVASNTAELAAGGSISGELMLPSYSAGVEVEIMAPSGEVVRRLPLGAQPAGSVQFSWDGRNANGEPMAPGSYRIRGAFFNGEKLEATQPYVKADIGSVSVPPGGGAKLHLQGIGTVSLADVKEIS